MDTSRTPSTAAARTSVGARGEDVAAAYLVAQGLEVVARNWRQTTGEVRGELDLVALDHGTATVVVCEVKTRRSDRFGGPLAAVTPRKQAQIRALTVAFLRAGELPYRTVRFDVVGIRLDAVPPLVKHVAAAF
ncbi:MAG: YraN family protein [Actinobacteria bacterium]|nr:YraN family protein [Actinomycetota bacterium]